RNRTRTRDRAGARHRARWHGGLRGNTGRRRHVRLHVPPPGREREAMSTVLLVEDDPALRRALRTMMRSRDFQIRDVDNGEDAIVIASGGGIDVIMLDLGLPDIDGIEVLHRVRSFSDVPVVVLTAHHQQSEKIRALDAGADDYVTKPFDPEEL